DIGPAYEALAAEGVEVIVVEQSTMLVVAHKQIAAVAAAKKVPTVYGYREHVEAGGLASYGVNLDWCYHRAGDFVTKYLGARTRPSCRWSSRPNLNWSSTSRPPGRSASPCRRRCSPAPTR